jgi:hypothetical protein
MRDPVWHPVLAAVEGEPGHWLMLDQFGISYGDVQLVRRGSEIGYRGRAGDGEVIGYYRTLRATTKAVHMKFVRKHTGAPVDPYEDPAHGMPPRG